MLDTKPAHAPAIAECRTSLLFFSEACFDMPSMHDHVGKETNQPVASTSWAGTPIRATFCINPRRTDSSQTPFVTQDTRWHARG